MKNSSYEVKLSLLNENEQLRKEIKVLESQLEKSLKEIETLTKENSHRRILPKINKNMPSVSILYFEDLKNIMPTISKTSIWRWMKSGKFPQARKIGDSRNYWLESEIQRWIKRIPAGEQTG